MAPPAPSTPESVGPELISSIRGILDTLESEAESEKQSEILGGNIVKENYARGEVTMVRKIRFAFSDLIARHIQGKEAPHPVPTATPGGMTGEQEAFLQIEKALYPHKVKFRALLNEWIKTRTMNQLMALIEGGMLIPPPTPEA